MMSSGAFLILAIALLPSLGMATWIWLDEARLG
jgi:hypothetical protein